MARLIRTDADDTKRDGTDAVASPMTQTKAEPAYKDLREINAELLARQSQLERELAAALLTKAAVESDADNLKRYASLLDSALNELRVSSDESARIKDSLAKDNAELKQRQSRLEGDLTVALMAKAVSEAELDNLKKYASLLDNVLSETRASLGEATRSKNELNVENKKLENQAFRLKEMLDSTNTILTNALAESEEARQSKIQLESKVARLNEKLTETVNALDKAINEKMATDTAASQMERQIASLANALASKGFGRSSLLNDMHWTLRLALKHGPKFALQKYLTIRDLRRLGQFDPVFYSHQLNQSVRDKHLLWHYAVDGFKLGFDPNRKFSTSDYLTFYSDVKAAGAEPYRHYLKHGVRENRIAIPSSLGISDAPATHFDNEDPTDVPGLEDRTQEEWITARNPEVDRSTLGLYDIRPDDEVPEAGMEGTAFLDRFRLLSNDPDFEGAAAYLSILNPIASIVSDENEPVDVSIVIPVYGQLAYTLNCLHSLVMHESRYSFEVLVGDDVSPDTTGEWLSKLPFIRFVRHAQNGGFIANCNRTSEHARGKWIVMLNNDTRVVDGWLDELIGSFTHFPKAGMVGSKLFYPDGSLQEAGGIIWRDGSAWNYGRNDDPNRPRYCFAREVDYVSGCSMAFPMDLWRQLGGFDNHYHPAYCEDSDICFRVREAGLETWFQPLSRVIHYEGKTSGTDLNVGAKAYQVTNSQKLLARWGNHLFGHRENGTEPWLEKERKVTKRVLIIDATNPTPWADAGSVTTTLTIRIYQALGYKVHFVPQDNFLYESKAVKAMQRLGVECAYAPYETGFNAYMKKYGHLFDVVQVFRFGVAEKCLPDIRRYAPSAKLIFNNMDLHFLRMAREAKLNNDAEGLRASEAIKIRELEVIRKVDCTVVPSTLEADILKDLIPQSPVMVFPYMTEFVGTETPYDKRRDIMFLGGFGHHPNRDAVEYFMEEIWPLIEHAIPDANYLIVGANPTDKIKAYGNARIQVTGLVDDLRPWFDRCRVFAASIRFGAGVKGKVSTAMAHGVPVVGTSCAAEGMGLVNGESVLLADTPSDFAKALILAYSNEAYWNKLSAQAQAFVRQNNSFEMGVRVGQQVIDVASSRLAKRQKLN